MYSDSRGCAQPENSAPVIFFNVVNNFCSEERSQRHILREIQVNVHAACGTFSKHKMSKYFFLKICRVRSYQQNPVYFVMCLGTK